MVVGLERLPTRPQALFMVGSGVDVAVLKSLVAVSTSLPVHIPEDAALALARGAALAAVNTPRYDASTVGLAPNDVTVGLAPSDDTSTVAGIITQRRVDVGDYAVGSATQNQALFELMDVSKMRVETALPEKEGLLARTGQPVRIALEGAPGKTLEAVVSRTAGAIDPSTRTMAVQADVINHAATLMPGMYARVSVGVERHENALLLPVAAVVFALLRKRAAPSTRRAARASPLRFSGPVGPARIPLSLPSISASPFVRAGRPGPPRDELSDVANGRLCLPLDTRSFGQSVK
jgi:hypothetical protein